MNKDAFLREWARKSGLTLKDAREIFRIFIEMLGELIENREELHLQGFGHMVYNTHKMSAYHNVVTGEMVKPENEEIEFVRFYLSRNLKDLMIKDPAKRRIAQTRAIEARKALEMNKVYADEFDENNFDSEMED